MDILTIILILLIILAIYLFINRNKKNVKSSAVKKEEIIQEYEKQMLEVIEKNRDNQSTLISEKTKLLKKINHELSMNLFFDEDEAKAILRHLNSLN